MTNIGDMMKQAQMLQKKMNEAQEKLRSIEVEGVSGGGMVKVLATAKGDIKKINIDEKTIKVKKELESGWFQWVELDLPASISIQLGLNKPRYASLRGIMAMKKKPLEQKSVDELGIEDMKTQVNIEKIFIPEKSKQTQYFDGTTDQIIEKLVDYFKNEIGVI